MILTYAECDAIKNMVSHKITTVLGCDGKA